MEQLPDRKLAAFLCWIAIWNLTVTAFGAGQWNGVAFTGWNGSAITSWNGTGVAVGGGGGTSPGTTNLIAWYDFADATDADGGTYNLTANNSPAYTAGPPSYGTATDGTPLAYWSQSSLNANFVNADGDWAFVMRWRGHTSVSNGDFVFSSNGGRAAIRWNTTAINGFCANASGPAAGIAPSLGVWYTVVLTHDTGANTLMMSINGSTLASSSPTPSYSSSGTAYFGGSSATVTNNIDIDFAGFYARELTQAEVDWLYNGGGTRVYSDL